MIHVVSEVVVLVGLTFYFNQKNKKLVAHIADLAQRVEEQEDLLQKHEQIIKQIVAYISKQQAASQHHSSVSQPQVRRSPPTRRVKQSQKVLFKPPAKEDLPSSSRVRVSFASAPQTSIEVVDDSNSEEEEDLDAELKEELSDLVETEDSLKKESQVKKDA